MKLKHILIITLVLMTALPLYLSLNYLNRFSNEQYRLQFSEKISALSLIGKKSVSGVVDRIDDNMALIASRTQMRLSLERWNSTHAQLEADRIGRILADAHQASLPLDELKLYDKQGQLVAHAGYIAELAATEADKPGQFSAKFKLQMEDTELYVVKMQQLVLNSQIIGWIEARFSVDFLTDMMADRSGLGVTGEWQLVTRHESGDALYVAPLMQDGQAAFKRRVASTRLDMPVIQALQGNETVMHSAPDYKGQPVMAATRYIAALGLGLVITVDEAEVNQLINKANDFTYQIEIASMLLAVLVGVAVALVISRPVEELILHTQQVTKGNYIEHRASGGWREIKELTSHFNLMVKAFKDLNGSLNQQVMKRTELLKQANQQLQDVASKDPLTGLYNRRFLTERLDQEISRCKRYQTSLALVMIDIDFFKRVNDTWGHAAGDEVLIKVSSYLRESLRESDVLARIGGEEFCLVLPSSSPNSSLAFLERLRHEISEISFEFDQQSTQVTCSFGIAYLNSHTANQHELMKAADQALYQAKASGRNLVQQYTAANG
jgi:diguanylate cyclase (GGDEF)-like protein